MFKYKVTYLRKCTHCSYNDEGKRIICAFKPVAMDTNVLCNIVRGYSSSCPRCNNPFECKPKQIVESRITLWDEVVDYCRNKEVIMKQKLFDHLRSIGVDVKVKYYTIYSYMAILQKSGFVNRTDSVLFEVTHTIPFGLRESECLKMGYINKNPIKSDKVPSRAESPSPFRPSYHAPSESKELVFEHAC